METRGGDGSVREGITSDAWNGVCGVFECLSESDTHTRVRRDALQGSSGDSY